MAKISAGGGEGLAPKRRRKPAPAPGPPPPRSEAAASSGYQRPSVPPRHTAPTGVFRNPLSVGPALHSQQRAQRNEVRKAQDALPGPAVRLPRRPTIAGGYTDAQRRDIIASTSKAVRQAASRGQLDDFLAHKPGEEMLWSQLGHLTDRQTRAAVHKYAGALQTTQDHADAALGSEWTQTHLSPVAPTLANLTRIGREVRDRQLTADTAAHPEAHARAPHGLGATLSGLTSNPLRTAKDALFLPSRIYSLPGQIIRATVEHPVQTAKTTGRTAVESIAGIPQGVKSLLDDPKHGIEMMAQDYAHRYGPLLSGDTKKFRKQIEQESGLTPFALDAAAAGAGLGRVAGAAAASETTARLADALAGAREPIFSRALRAAHETATMERPGLRFGGGEAGVVRQETSPNLFKAAGQRGLDAARRRKFEQRAAHAGLRPTEGGQLERIPGASTTSRTDALRPGANEVLPYYSLKEAAPLRRLTGRVARDIGGAKSKGRILLLTRRARALHDIEKQMKRLGPDERAALMPVVKYGLPAVKDAASRDRALALIDRRITQIEKARKDSGKDVATVLGETNDEVKLLQTIRADPEKYLTPTLRDATDQMLKVQRREEAIDPDLPAARSLIRRKTEQGKLLGVRRGRDEQYLRDRLGQIELKHQGRGLEVQPGQVQESHGALAQMLPAERPAVAARIEKQAQARWNAAKGAQAKAREDLANATGRSEILSRNVTGTRAGEELAAKGKEFAGGGLGVAQARAVVEAANAEAVAARDAYAVARDVTRTVKNTSTHRLEPAEAFDARVSKAAQEAGLSEPGYWMSTPRPSDTYSTAAIGSGGRAVAKSKRYTGALSDIGAETHTPEVLVQGVERNVKRRFSWALVNRNMEVYAFDWSRGARGEGLTASELLKALDERHIEADTVSFLNSRILRSRAPEEAGVARGEVVDQATAEDHLLTDVNRELVDARTTLDDLKSEEVQGLAMNRYIAVPREVGNELEHATRPDGAWARGLEIVLKQKPSRILLGMANVPWLSFQVASNAFLTGLGGGFNPLDVFGAHKWFNALSDGERDAVEVELGITHGRHFALDQTHLGATKDRLGPAAHLVDFWQAYKKSRVGRLAHSINPMDLMFRADEAQNNFFRKILFYNQAKKTAYRDMGADWRSIDGVQKRLMRTLALPPERMGGEIVKKGELFERHAKHVNDFLGNYLTFSNQERQLLSRNVMFYGYLRYSLRFTFWTMPVEHPVVTALMTNLGRMGSDEIKRLFGVPMDYRLPTSMLAQVYSGATPAQVKAYIDSDGKRGKLPNSVNIGRANPMLNTFTQLDPNVPSQAIGVVSPLYQALADQLIEKNTFTGKDWTIKGQPTPSASERSRGYYGSIGDLLIPGTPRNRIFVNELLGLAYPYRLAQKTGIGPLGVKPMLGPQGDDSLLFSQRPITYKTKAINDSIARSTASQAAEPRLRNQILPFFPQSNIGPVIVARDRQKLSDSLDQGQKKKKRGRPRNTGTSYGGSSSSSATRYGGSGGSNFKSRYGG